MCEQSAGEMKGDLIVEKQRRAAITTRNKTEGCVSLLNLTVELLQLNAERQQ